MVDFVEFRRDLFLRTVEPVIVTLLGPVVEEESLSGTLVSDPAFLSSSSYSSFGPCSRTDINHFNGSTATVCSELSHRRLGFLPNYVEDVSAFKETSMSFATLMMLFVIMSCIFLIFLSCFYHNQKTSPLFISPRRHRLPKLVPPPLPVDGYFDWVRDTMMKTNVWDGFYIESSLFSHVFY
jgi:hypothetical protein